MPESVVDDLAARGHRIQIARAWSLGNVTAVRINETGSLEGSATSRGQKAYAIGW